MNDILERCDACGKMDHLTSSSDRLKPSDVAFTLLCTTCRESKGDKVLGEWMVWLMSNDLALLNEIKNYNTHLT